MKAANDNAEYKKVTFRTTKSDKKALQGKAKKLGISLNRLVCDVIANYLVQQKKNEQRERKEI